MGCCQSGPPENKVLEEDDQSSARSPSSITSETTAGTPSGADTANNNGEMQKGMLYLCHSLRCHSEFASISLGKAQSFHMRFRWSMKPLLRINKAQGKIPMKHF